VKLVIIVTTVFALAASPAYAVDPLGPTPLDPGEAVERMREVEVGRTEAQVELQGNIRAGGEMAAGWLAQGIEIQGAASDLLQSYRALTTADATCMDLSDAGAPAVPTSCADSDACGQCFTDAQRRLDGMRINLERLRCVYTAAKKFSDDAIAFGDSASGVHALTGLAWQTEKRGIQEAVENLKHTYDEKYRQMLPNLRSSLEGLGECEARFFHNNDWYNRFGFIYYTFMADRYKRSD
jgi:hypothetical protein